MTALGEFSKVADIVYLEVDDRAQADFIYTSYSGHAGTGHQPARLDEPARRERRGPRPVQFGRRALERPTCSRAASPYVTLIHEFGHGHGLAHPHDNGGHSGIMHGVEAGGQVPDPTGRRLHDRRLRPEPGRLHDDVLRGRLADLALRQCRRPTSATAISAA
jgi:hypothetical protein